MEILKTSFGRRSFLKASAAGGGLALSFNLATAPNALAADAKSAPSEWFELNAVLSIQPSGAIQVRVQNPEFGQGLMTTFPMIAAEELEANWEDVTSVTAPYDQSRYKMQLSGGSWSTSMNYPGLRMAGATALHMLKTAAANAWNVPVEDVNAANSVLSHSGGKTATYGEMAAAAAILPVPEKVALKDKKDFSIIGTSRKNLTGSQVVKGDSLFGIDVREKDMLRAVVVHAPAFGLTVDSFDAESVKRMPGIHDVFTIKMYPDDLVRGFSDVAAFREVIAIVGDHTWQLMKAKKALKVNWKVEDSYSFTSSDFFGNQNKVTVPKGLEDTATHNAIMAAMVETGEMETKRKDGDPMAAFANAAKVVEHTYHAPFLAHNTLEPMNFYADVKEDSAMLIGPHQGPMLIHNTVAAHIGLPAEKIDFKMTRMGGGFGRRLYPHWATEVSLISQRVKRPVHLIYTREDDMTVGVYRPSYTIKMRAALDANNKIIGYHVRSAGTPEACSFPNRFPAGAIDNYLWEESPNVSNITVGAFRAPNSNFMASAEQSFLDELAEAMGADPIQMRLDLLKRAQENPVGTDNDYDAVRYASVLELARDKSDWNNRGDKNMGVAAYFCHNSYCCNIVDIDMKNGLPVINSVTSALDCGQVVNYEGAINMAQGGIVDGVGISMFGEMTFVEGQPQHKNLDTYRMVRINESPRAIDVHFVKNEHGPTGLGEPPMPPTPPALANAMYKATGHRFRNQPFITDLETLKS